MKLVIKVKTNAKKASVEKTIKGEYSVSVKESPIEGKANVAVIKAVAKYFKVPLSRITIKAGQASKIKRVEIDL